MKKDDILKLEITDYAFEGKGVSKIYLGSGENSYSKEGEVVSEKPFVIFITNGYPGDIAEVKITKKKGNYAEGKIVNLLQASPERTKPICKYTEDCGGCKQQDMNYDSQVKYKKNQVIDIYTKMGKFTDFQIDEVIGSENRFFYRNKMEFSFGDKKWLTQKEIESGSEIDRSFALGLHIPNRFDKILDIDECFLQSEISNKILNFTKQFFKERNSSIYSTKTHTGYLRNLMIRDSKGKKSDKEINTEIMVNIVTSESNPELMTEYADALLKKVPEVTTIVNNITTRKSSVAIGETEEIIYGSGFIRDYIGGYEFQITANSFFQTNTQQAERLYQTALNYAELQGDEVLYDLYSGAGTIAIFFSAYAKAIYGFEAVEESVKNAEKNIRNNEIENVFPHVVDLYKSFIPYIENNNIPKPDIIISDPPRNGMHPNTVNDLLTILPKKIVYISCNPATQVRDICMLLEKYKLERITTVDMFPQTFHIENVALLRLIE